MKRPAPAVRQRAQREPVWLALSTLFLDCAPDPCERIDLATQLAQSRYCSAELEWILRVELAPLLAINLRVVAGVWQGFDPDWLAERVLARQRGRLWPLRRWWRERFPSRVEDWPALRAAIESARGAGASNRGRP